MRAKISIALLMLAVSATAAPASAKAVAKADAPPVEAGTGKPIRLAQVREVEIYYDDFGRRVVVDAYTGRVIDVLPPTRDRYRRPAWRDDFSGQDDDNDLFGGLTPRQLRERQQHFAPDDMFDDPPAGWRARSRPAPPVLTQPGAPRFEETRPGVYEQVQPGLQARGEEFDDEDDGALPDLSPPADSGSSGDTPDRAMLSDPTRPQVAPPTIRSRVPFVEGAPALGPITSSAAVAQVQILLDRAGASPGVIDGKFGDNVRKALVSYKEITGHDLSIDDAGAVKAALEASGGPAFTHYTITNKDAAGPYIASVPSDYGAKAKLDRLGYASVAEMLAERFHMDEDYLKELNPRANFNRPGTIIKVASVGEPVAGPVARVVANKKLSEVLAYDADGKLIASYPSTIGSTDTPSPSGTVKVDRVAFDPTYTYNPKVNFKQGDNDSVLTIPPGPNGPVGSVWIALSKPTYGIHGTPEPDKIGKTSSHGCVRLTNWDAQELAKMVSPGVWVQFVD